MANAPVFKRVKPIKLNLFQEVEKLGLNPSQTVNTNLLLLQVRVLLSPPKFLWGNSSMVEWRY
ncbi:MAG: hypothetical protein LUM44_03075 [Pyrinomonadaceae bacterium]|nr:hypothetical protein [Pyrinomonadaceae bacterium]